MKHVTTPITKKIQSLKTDAKSIAKANASLISGAGAAADKFATGGATALAEDKGSGEVGLRKLKKKKPENTASEGDSGDGTSSTPLKSITSALKGDPPKKDSKQGDLLEGYTKVGTVAHEGLTKDKYEKKTPGKTTPGKITGKDKEQMSNAAWKNYLKNESAEKKARRHKAEEKRGIRSKPTATEEKTDTKYVAKTHTTPGKDGTKAKASVNAEVTGFKDTLSQNWAVGVKRRSSERSDKREWKTQKKTLRKMAKANKKNPGMYSPEDFAAQKATVETAHKKHIAPSALNTQSYKDVKNTARGTSMSVGQHSIGTVYQKEEKVDATPGSPSTTGAMTAEQGKKLGLIKGKSDGTAAEAKSLETKSSEIKGEDNKKVEVKDTNTESSEDKGKTVAGKIIAKAADTGKKIVDAGKKVVVDAAEDVGDAIKKVVTKKEKDPEVIEGTDDTKEVEGAAKFSSPAKFMQTPKSKAFTDVLNHTKKQPTSPNVKNHSVADKYLGNVAKQEPGKKTPKSSAFAKIKGLKRGI